MSGLFFSAALASFWTGLIALMYRRRAGVFALFAALAFFIGGLLS